MDDLEALARQIIDLDRIRRHARENGFSLPLEAKARFWDLLERVTPHLAREYLALREAHVSQQETHRGAGQ